MIMMAPQSSRCFKNQNPLICKFQSKQEVKPSIGTKTGQ